jgi:hypothetical protein
MDLSLVKGYENVRRERALPLRKHAKDRRKKMKNKKYSREMATQGDFQDEQRDCLLNSTDIKFNISTVL